MTQPHGATTGVTRGAGRGPVEGAGVRRRERNEAAAAAAAAPVITNTAAAGAAPAGSAQASGSRTSGRKRKPTQLPGAQSPKRDSSAQESAERQVPQPLMTLPPPGLPTSLPPIPSSAHTAAGVRMQMGLGGGQPETAGLNPTPLQVQRPAHRVVGGVVEGGVQGEPTQSLPDLSPFATPGIMGNLAGHFPCWQQPQQQQGQQPPQQQQQQQQNLHGAQQPLNGPAALKAQQQGISDRILPAALLRDWGVRVCERGFWGGTWLPSNKWV
eukprot:1154335-Pelagomonas_calceolata.AAC.3